MRGHYLAIILIVACSPSSELSSPKGESLTAESSVPATIACSSLYESVCRSQLPLSDFLKQGKKETRELVASLRPNYPGDYPKLVQAVEVKMRLRIGKTRETLSQLFKKVQMLLIEAVQAESISAVEKRWAIERISKVRFAGTGDLLVAYGGFRPQAQRVFRYCGGDTLDKITAALMVDYGLESGVVMVCPALYLAAHAYRNEGRDAVEKALFWIFAHEVGHLMDPLIDTRGLRYDAYFKCLFKDKPLPREQYGEIAADYWANKALLLFLKEKGDAESTFISQIQEAHFLRCGSLEPTLSDDAHPAARYRLDMVARTTPGFRDVLSCMPERCCSLSGPC